MPKLDQQKFEALVERVRGGEQSAAADLVRLYEPEIRREVRLRLTSAQLRRTLDSVDVCQSVFGRFFIKAALGELDFDRPQQLLRLLCQMARNRVIDHHRREKVRLPAGNRVSLENVTAAQSDTPSQVLQHEELLQKVSELMTESERQVSSMRRDGESWASIAQQVGGTAESVRKSLSRALDRITEELEISF